MNPSTPSCRIPCSTCDREPESWQAWQLLAGRGPGRMVMLGAWSNQSGSDSLLFSQCRGQNSSPPPPLKRDISICPRVHAIPPIPPSKGSCQGKKAVIFPGRDTALLWHTLSCLMEKGPSLACSHPHQVTESLKDARWPLAPREPTALRIWEPREQKLPHDLRPECLLSDFCRATHAACCHLAHGASHGPRAAES